MFWTWRNVVIASVCSLILPLVNLVVIVPLGEFESTFRATVCHCSTEIIKGG